MLRSTTVLRHPGSAVVALEAGPHAVRSDMGSDMSSGLTHLNEDLLRTRFVIDSRRRCVVAVRLSST
jgi:hypothetical protein